MKKEKEINDLKNFFLSMDTYDHKECNECGKWLYDKCDEECFSKQIAKDLYNAGYRKQIEGRWKGAGLGDYYCSLCCKTYSGADKFNYCPNCGAKMKDGE